MLINSRTSNFMKVILSIWRTSFFSIFFRCGHPIPRCEEENSEDETSEEEDDEEYEPDSVA